MFHCLQPEPSGHTGVTSLNSVLLSSNLAGFSVQVEKRLFARGAGLFLHLVAEGTWLSYGPQELGFHVPVKHDGDVLQLRSRLRRPRRWEAAVTHVPMCVMKCFLPLHSSNIIVVPGPFFNTITSFVM